MNHNLRSVIVRLNFSPVNKKTTIESVFPWDTEAKQDSIY